MRADRRPPPRGQALVEVLVALVVLMPLFFGIAWIAKLIDARQSAQSAARALAFDCTVHVAVCESGSVEVFADATRARFFASHRLGVHSESAALDAVRAGDRRAAWTDRDGRPLLERFDDVGVGAARARFDSPLAFAGGLGERAMPGAVRVLSELAGPGRFGLDLQGGLLDARVAVRLAASRPADAWVRQLRAAPVPLQAHVTLLADAWNASGPYGDAYDTVETRVHAGAELPLVEPAIDAAWLGVRALIATAGLLGIEPSASALRWHEIDVDLVPPDRVAGGSAPARAPSGTDQP